MGRLSDFREYVSDRHAKVASIESSLLSLQEHYESFFAEICRVREEELAQLEGHLTGDREALGEALRARVDETRAAVEKELGVQLASLEERIARLEEEAEGTRVHSEQSEAAIRKKNTELDSLEEQLEARSEGLAARIAEYNRRIREMSGGFGFFANFFRMRGVRKERDAIEQEREDVRARVESLRQQWRDAEGEHAESEQGLQRRWVELRTEAAALSTKRDHLRSSRERIVTRTTLERILFELVARPALGEAGDPACGRCGRRNPATNHFCAYCARRLRDDRPDLRGSWEEIAELNHHHAVFSDGMRACQEIIGLIRGLRSGMEAFAESVDDMIASEKRHSLAKLDISVPAPSVAYGKYFDNFGEQLSLDDSRHPVVFAQGVRQLLDEVFTEERIKGFFETMGQELSVQAEAQW